jgi:acetylornithine deacetylase/succinyl-diaminopimelate desuccinylase-like protein
MKNLDEIELLKTIIAIDSSNPGPYELELARFFADLASQFGFESEIIESQPNRANLIIKVDAGGSRTLGLSGHLDTKPVGEAAAEWNTPPWELVIDGDIGYGLGSSDMKGGMAAMFVAAVEWSKTAKSGNLSLIFTADEEAGSVHGAKYLSDNYPLKADAILVGEPSGVKEPWESIFTISRGISCFEVVIQGKQGHSGLSPTLTTSATVAAAKVILALSEFKPSFPKQAVSTTIPTVNPAVVIGGGVTYGVHPGEARIKCDIRLVPGMTQEQLALEINQVVSSSLPQDVRFQVNFEKGIGWMPAVEIDNNHALSQAVQAAAKQVLNKDVPFGTYPGGTDATHFINGAKIPTLASIGPGWLSVAHGPNEKVGISQVRQAKEIYKRTAELFLESDR